MSSLATLIGSATFGTVLAQAVAGPSDTTSNLILIAVVAGGFTAGGATLSAFITAHFASKTAIAVAAATAQAAAAARAAQEAKEATRELGVKTIEMSGLLDGKLEELIRLSRAEAEAQGMMKERDRAEARATEVAAQARIDAATVRSDAKEDRHEERQETESKRATDMQTAREDRAEGAAAALTAPPVSDVPVPVETRTEAQEREAKPGE